ncbi:MAG: hypothetical protein OHK93_004021 [Ramalina farinacea]|uniref:Uncharacterized protein n=1 Tax=Ramalina farinacea TaxID=258253 RepID=A0AA43QFZ2_9LECA|nr:hypothetical protein [Ramalina farinacea]
MASRAEKLHDQDEPHPDPQALTSNPDESQNSSTGVDYEPHPESSLKITQERQHIIDSISRLYSGSCSEDDMRVYAKEAIYDDPWSYCDSRYKIAGQWYGIPAAFASSKTISTEVVSNEPKLLVFKMQREYTPRIVHFTKSVNSLVSLTLDDQEKVKYHKEMWNHNDYSHQGLGKVMKTLNGDQLTRVTKPPDWM